MLAHTINYSGDPVRPTLPLGHLPSYYHEYFGKEFAIRSYGFQEFGELAAILTDTIEINDRRDSLAPRHGVDTDFGSFVRLAEACRRERIRRLDAGDESVLLKFLSPPRL